MVVKYFVVISIFCLFLLFVFCCCFLFVLFLKLTSINEDRPSFVLCQYRWVLIYPHLATSFRSKLSSILLLLFVPKMSVFFVEKIYIKNYFFKSLFVIHCCNFLISNFLLFVFLVFFVHGCLSSINCRRNFGLSYFEYINSRARS